MANQNGAKVPRRLARPKWLDPRLIGGILLVVVAVVVGSRVIAASARTTAMWSATHTLAVGTVIIEGDLDAVEVNLGDIGSGYLGAGSNPVGRTLISDVRVGELLPVGALGAGPNGRIVVIPVPPEKFPPGVQHGSIIDLYLTTGAVSASAGGPTTGLLQAGLTVQSVTAPASGGLSGASSNQYQIAVLVDRQAADTLVRALPGGEAVVVLVSGAGG